MITTNQINSRWRSRSRAFLSSGINASTTRGARTQLGASADATVALQPKHKPLKQQQTVSRHVEQLRT